MDARFEEELRLMLPLVEDCLRPGDCRLGGILLHGPSGVGKSATLEALVALLPPGVSRHRVDCTALFGSVLGDAEARLEAHFVHLEACAPSVALFEDIEGLGRAGNTGVTAVRTRALLCRLMDGLQVNLNLQQFLFLS